MNLEPTEIDGFSAVQILITYAGHLPKDELREHIVKVAEKWSRKVKEIVIAHEIGKTDYDHTHVCVQFNASRYWGPLWFDYGDIHPNLRRIKGTKPDWRRVVGYICKQDMETAAGVTAEPPHRASADEVSIGDVMVANSIHDLEHMPLRLATNAFAVLNARSQDPPMEWILGDMYPWQNFFARQILLRRACDRRVVWIFDKKGANGKTAFCKHMVAAHPDKCRMITSIGKVSDFNNNLSNFIKNGFEGDTYLFNLSRSYAEKEHIYEALENIKDGVITCTKYTGGVFYIPATKVYVFANFMPNLSALSNDRWEIYTLNHGSLWLGGERITLDYARPDDDLTVA